MKDEIVYKIETVDGWLKLSNDKEPLANMHYEADGTFIKGSILPTIILRLGGGVGTRVQPYIKRHTTKITKL